MCWAKRRMSCQKIPNVSAGGRDPAHPCLLQLNPAATLPPCDTPFPAASAADGFGREKGTGTAGSSKSFRREGPEKKPMGFGRAEWLENGASAVQSTSAAVYWPFLSANHGEPGARAIPNPFYIRCQPTSAFVHRPKSSRFVGARPCSSASPKNTPGRLQCRTRPRDGIASFISPGAHSAQYVAPQNPEDGLRLWFNAARCAVQVLGARC